jgi:hypothetical protein
MTAIYKLMRYVIVAGNYEKVDMTAKADFYLKYKKITQDEYDELIALMEADVE